MQRPNSDVSVFRNIPEILTQAIEKYPDHIALDDPTNRWTYAQLGSLTQSARRQCERLIRNHGQRVAIIGDNHPGYIVAYFGAQSAGIPTVEISRHTPLENLVEVVDQTEAGLVITDREELMKVVQPNVPVLSFEELLGEPIGFDRNDFETNRIQPKEDQEASIVFTSGTTGFPKGVVLTHSNFCFVVSAVTRYLGLNHMDRYALILPLCHTYGKSVLLTTIAAGATILMPVSFHDIHAFMQFLVQYKCTVLSAVPYHAHLLLKWVDLSQHDLSNLRTLTFSSNKLPVATIDRLKEALPQVQIFSMYGLTETTTRACYVPPDRLAGKKASCGRPLPGVELKIIGENGTELAPGKSGEVYLRGPNIMQRYFKDEALTGQSLELGWLKTGDIGYVDEEGFLYLVAREKDIIKCAGERLSPMEIEEVLAAHPDVSEVAVIGSPDAVHGEIVHAFIVPSAASIDQRELKKFCAQRLSQHKQPRKYSIVDEIAKTSTGKIKKHILRKASRHDEH